MNRLFSKIGDFIVKNAKLNIIVIALITVFLAVGLPRIEMNMGNEMFVSSDSDVLLDTATYQENFGAESAFIIINGDKDSLFTPETLKEVLKLSEGAVEIDNITGSTEFVSMIDELMSNENMSIASISNGDSSELQNALMSEISEEDVEQILQQQMNSLTAEQLKQIQAFQQAQLTPEQLQQIAAEMANLGAAVTPEVQAGIINGVLTEEQTKSIADYTQSILTEEQNATMQKLVMEALPSLTEMSTETLQQIVFSDNGNVPSQLQMLLPDNGANILIKLDTSDSSEMETNVNINNKLNELIDEANFAEGIIVKTAGGPIVQGNNQSEVMVTMAILLSLAVVLMIVVLFFVFPVRRRIISLGFVLIGLVATFGFIGWVGLPLTIATMATLPIIIGLGTDFGVQFHNRYEEEFKKSNYNAAEAVRHAVSHIGPSVGIAVFIMALSFLTMFLSKAPMMQQFGLTLAIGVVICYIIELIMMFSIFYLLDRNNESANIKDNKDTVLSRFLGRYAGFVGRFAIPILVIAIAVSAYGFSIEDDIPVETNTMKWLPQDMEALVNTRELQELVGSTTYITYLVEAEDVTDAKVVHWMNEFAENVDATYEEIGGQTTIASLTEQLNGSLATNEETLKNQIEGLPGTLKQTVISENNQFATIQFQINQNLSTAEQLELLHKMNEHIDADESIVVKPAGSHVLMLYGIDNITANSGLMKNAGLLIIFIGLFLIYRRLKDSIFPLIPIALVLGFSPLSLNLLDIPLNPLTTALGCLVLGVGTEFTILIMERFKEEQAKGLSDEDAIKVSLSKVGQAITASGLTVIFGFSALIFASFPILSDFGFTTVIDTTLSLICALTILPALIILFAKKKKYE
ncbi:hydrophobe/amphiphile efflux-3 (HAE3) family transporter [Sutcliffiella horikoshii]|uniref:efflux RND transporter permease subunit n=1 Tax=Sutcliffiella horikoshii TaxID=79883 RepID=UPI00384B5108